MISFPPLDVPGFDNSAMDGYAVRLADLADGARRCRLRVKRSPDSRSTMPGLREAVFRIMTGSASSARLRRGSDAGRDRADRRGHPLRRAGQRPGQNIRRRGEDIADGAVVFPAGTPLTVAELPVLALAGDCPGGSGAQSARRGLLDRGMNCSCRASRWATGKFTIPTASPFT
ncbi:Molybdopterin molybdenumtransferase [Raoultella planticola]|uniref:Molybdopterin molybdenumtransferase n=1 Tax=Raoultella planticola TaxID=575 RepID=A0A485AST9_RAOPL|nr:Molybdopterin molybdenumtransferase [Raoultella planticola]